MYVAAWIGQLSILLTTNFLVVEHVDVVSHFQ
jgi:hypothetical protein